MTENVNFQTDEFTFTASDPLCPSGTFTDTVLANGGGPVKLNAILRSTYTCDDGSGTFTAIKHIFIEFNPDGSTTHTGPMNFIGGTGDYVRLRGHATNEGGTSPEGIAVGNVSGFINNPR